MNVYIDTRTDEEIARDAMARALQVITTAAMYTGDEPRWSKRTEIAGFTLDTREVYDAVWHYETAICHEKYNDGNWIILGGCDTQTDAEKIHNNLVEYFRNNIPPALRDKTIGILYLRDTE